MKEKHILNGSLVCSDHCWEHPSPPTTRRCHRTVAARGAGSDRARQLLSPRSPSREGCRAAERAAGVLQASVLLGHISVSHSRPLPITSRDLRRSGPECLQAQRRKREQGRLVATCRLSQLPATPRPGHAGKVWTSDWPR